MSLPTVRKRAVTLAQQPGALLAAVTIAGALVRVYHLASRSLWYDEGAFYWIAAQPLGAVVAQNAVGSSGPPLFPLIVHAAIQSSTSVAAFRGVSCVAGIAAVPAIYFLAAEFVPTSFACVAATLLALSPAQVARAQDAREYTLALVLAIGLLIVFVRYYRTPSWPLAGAFAAFGVAALFTQYGLAILLLGLNAVMLTSALRSDSGRRALPAWIAAQVCCLLAVPAVYLLSLRQQFSPAFGSSYLGPGYWGGTIRSLAHLVIVSTYQIVDFAFPAPLMIVVCALGAFQAVRMRQLALVMPLAVLPMIATVGLAVARAYPYMGGRQTIFLTPMLYVLAAIGIWYLWRGASMPVPAAAIVILMATLGLGATVGYLRSPSTEEVKPIVERVLASSAPGDHIYVYYGAAPVFGYYTRSDHLAWTRGIESRSAPARYYQQLDPLIEDHHPLWLVFAHEWTDEIPNIVDYVRQRRPVTLVQTAANAWLFVAR